MRHPTRGPNLLGIGGKPSAAGRRIDHASAAANGDEAPRVNLPAPTTQTRAKGLAASERRALAPPMPLPWLAILGLAALLSGCPAATDKNTRNERWYDAVVEPLQSEPERALRFHDRIARLKGADLAQALEAARQDFEKDKSGLHRIQLAMILSLPGASFRDDQAAAQLLQPFLRDKVLEDSPLRPLAFLLNGQLAEIRKLDEALQQQSAKTKEEQRKSEALQQKLEALLEMEMKMLEREQTIPTKKK